MADKAFQHADGGLREQLLANVVNTERPFMERFISGVALMTTRAVLDEVNKRGLALPGTEGHDAAPATSLPKPEVKPEGAK